jgi:alpha-L-rhamnosidase
MKTRSLTALLLAPLIALHAVEPKLPALAIAAPISITDMRTEGVAQPMGVEEAAPRFSWRYEASPQAPRGFRQSALRIQVASSLEKLSQGDADMWDSGRQAGSETLNVLYAGKPLQSATRYFWQVTGFDADGKTYSAQPHYFETGLLKADDWSGAEWIGARNERPKTIPANLQRLGDATFETRFRILDGSAVVLFQTTYAWGKDNKLEIHTGQPGKLIVTPFDSKNKSAASKEFALPMNMAPGTWHSLKVIRQGGQATFEIDGQKVATETLPADAGKTGTLALGASAKPKQGVVQYDDFRLISGGETLVKESFDNPAVFAFQEYFYSSKYYSMVKDGMLEVRALNTYLDPKDGLAAPLFRKTFATEPKKIVRARAYVSGLGYYTFWLNGNRLDDFLLHPGFARFNKTAYYTVYDLTKHLAANNALAFELGRGWYAMTTPTLWGETFTGDWMAEPALRVLVTIDYADGSRQTVVSNPSFKTTPGPILVDSIKAGEIYDARKELPGWNSVSFDDKNWSHAVVASGKMPSAAPGLTAQLFEPIRVVETVSPVSIEKVADEPDAWVVDFGKHMAGTVELKVRAEPGQKIRMNHLESSVVRNGRERWNNFDAHATGSFQTDVYIAKGGGEEVSQARYSYKGFRYVHIVGLKEKPSSDQVTAKVFNTDMARVGDFRSSSELWNKIWEAGRRSIQSNMHSIPTDCPQWEKLGWTCDDASPFYAMAYNYDLRKLYEKRLQDFADDISPDGKIRNVVPSSWAKGEDPAWVGSYVAIAWKHYQTYGDRRMIERHYDNLKLYMSTLIKEGEASEKPPLLTKPRRALGDWVSPDGNVPPEGALIYFNLYFFQYARQMAEMAKVVGRAEDEKVYSTLAAALKKRFHEHHFDEKEGCYYSSNREAGFRQSPQAIALAFGLVPEDKVAGVVSRLVEDIQQRRKGHFWVGILGMEAIADALCENGRADVAYAAHLRDVGPSLGNMIREGATTIWEDYSITKARSLNHKMFATPLGWMARYVAGLHVGGVLGEGPGFRKVVISPHPAPALLQFAELDYDSPVGRYHSGWKAGADGIHYDIKIPPNASAIVRFPIFGKKAVMAGESGRIFWKNGKSTGAIDGAGIAHLEQQQLVIPLGSGSYSFTVKN